MPIPNITFKNTEQAKKYLNALLEAMLKQELDQEKLCALDIYCAFLPQSNCATPDLYVLVNTMVGAQMIEHGYSEDSLRVLISRLDEEGIERMENSIIMEQPSLTWVELQVVLANAIIGYFNTLE